MRRRSLVDFEFLCVGNLLWNRWNEIEEKQKSIRDFTSVTSPEQWWGSRGERVVKRLNYDYDDERRRRHRRQWQCAVYGAKKEKIHSLNEAKVVHSILCTVFSSSLVVCCMCSVCTGLAHRNFSTYQFFVVLYCIRKMGRWKSKKVTKTKRKFCVCDSIATSKMY